MSTSPEAAAEARTAEKDRRQSIGTLDLFVVRTALSTLEPSTTKSITRLHRACAVCLGSEATQPAGLSLLLFKHAVAPMP